MRMPTSLAGALNTPSPYDLLCPLPRACSFFVWVATPVRYLACGLSVCVLSVKFGVTAPRRAYEAPVACAFDWGHETLVPRLRMRRIRTQPLARDSYPSPMSTDAYATVGKGSMYPSRLSTDSYGARRTYASQVHVIRMSHVPRRREVSMSYVADGSVRSRRQGFHVPYSLVDGSVRRSKDVRVCRTTRAAGGW